mgnify:CR=1 FL=1
MPRNPTKNQLVFSNWRMVYKALCLHAQSISAIDNSKGLKTTNRITAGTNSFSGANFIYLSALRMHISLQRKHYKRKEVWMTEVYHDKRKYRPLNYSWQIHWCVCVCVCVCIHIFSYIKGEYCNYYIKWASLCSSEVT